MTTDLLIFDCDGVLIDSEPVASGLLAEALQRSGVSVSAADVHRRFTGASEKECRCICVDEFGLLDVDRVFSEMQSRLFDEFSRSLRPMPGMAGLVRSLPHLKCVASNSTTERLRRSLGLFDLWAEFAPNIFSAEMVERPKPAPDLFELCTRTFSVEPERCVVIDDSAHGIAGAVAAGMRAIGFVDSADPPAGRHTVLKEAGASLVAEGSAELAAAIGSIALPRDAATIEAAPAQISIT
ncbi:HAD family hydrolase [Pseudaminobacter sp. 19-2017]|uniref:HAD family hydrolase n=1 Tax=Pseudaminobacter soli (ex Zhang et al. 2022) TaxID=2831468 RepID=A0A942E7C4_9HYPH|nr:HAD family hydrolase [Pseudaminobacter soli]MBS3651810.1 HAD family hydrolase [Pseudaminobacter soli]